jgi:hypothetical protein
MCGDGTTAASDAIPNGNIEDMSVFLDKIHAPQGIIARRPWIPVYLPPRSFRRQSDHFTREHP